MNCTRRNDIIMTTEIETPLCCRFCFTDLWHEHSFIKCSSGTCAELNVSICLQCFAAGAGDDVHKNSDPYRVLCNAVDIGNRLWDAREEIVMLDTFMETMSWERVAQTINRSPKECERHYFENYVLCPKIKGLECVNKNAFRYDKFNNVIDDWQKTMDNSLDLEGTNLIY